MINWNHILKAIFFNCDCEILQQLSEQAKEVHTLAEISSSQLKSAQEPGTKILDKTKISKKSQRTVLSWISLSSS